MIHNNKIGAGWILAGIFLLVGIVGLTFLDSNRVTAAEPFGANVTEISTERAPEDAATSWEAYAGNVTEVTINGFSITQTWQGFYGNVTGTIQLADANDNVFYNWSLASPRGEVYASTNSTIEWGSITCFNFTAVGNHSAESSGGGTSLYGTNLTQLESEFGINNTDVDGVNETFGFTAISHNLFYTASLEFAAGECLATAPYDNNGQSTDGQFEEVLMYEPNTYSTVFAALLENDANGFDNATHDFQMLVLEDGHGTDTVTTPYYFFVELE